jgi:uncharacterized LabA/DUF88 family protein
MARITFLVDGFNLYHSVNRADRDFGPPARCKWLDIKALFASYVPNFATEIGATLTLEAIHYFSALAAHRVTTHPDTVKRHSTYIRALESTGVQVTMGRFKKKKIWCDGCQVNNKHYEEKETDVAIAIRMLELAFFNKTDVLCVVSGDTDLAPAIREIRVLCPHLKIVALFPYLRKNNEIAQLVDASIVITKEQYAKHQFPTPVVLPGGKQIHKPASW